MSLADGDRWQQGLGLAVEAEQGLLGCLLVSPDSYGAIAAIVRPDHFFEPAHRMLFEAMAHCRTSGRQGSLGDLRQALGVQNLTAEMASGINLSTYIGRLCRDGATTLAVADYARSVRDHWAVRTLMAAKRIPEIPVFVDSPMAIAATKVHRRHRKLYNPEARAILAQGQDPFSTPRYVECRKWKQSRMLDKPVTEPTIIIGSSGMAAGGRILGHLETRLPHADATIWSRGQRVGHASERGDFCVRLLPDARGGFELQCAAPGSPDVRRRSCASSAAVCARAPWAD